MTLTFRTLLASTAATLFAACDSSSADRFVRSFASPDQAYVAVQVTEVRREFAGSSCIDTIVVVPSKDLSSGKYPVSSRAYVGACHSLRMTLINGHPAKPNGPQLRWTAPRELSIVFDPTLARNGVPGFYSVTSLYDGAITIRNEPQ